VWLVDTHGVPDTAVVGPQEWKPLMKLSVMRFDIFSHLVVVGEHSSILGCNVMSVAKFERFEGL
jgi:hypothetical protein